MSRRDLLKNSAGLAGIGFLGTSMENRFKEADKQVGADLKGKVNHSACRWCYDKIPFEELVVNAKKIGLQSIELTGPEEWDILKKYDMTAAIGWGKYPEKMGLPNFFKGPKPRQISGVLRGPDSPCCQSRCQKPNHIFWK